MRPSALAAVTLFVSFAAAVACSSSPDLPPVQTTNTNTNPSPGASSSPTQNTDAGASSSTGNDSGTLDGAITIDAGTPCTTGSCIMGCCNSINMCETGTANSACGTLGAPCTACTTGQTCSMGFCQ